MINHADILKDELRKANQQINKKHSVLKKELQKTIEVFENNIPVFPYEVCFGLFRQVTESNSSSNSLAMLPFFQAVINLGFANEPMMEEILQFLSRTCGMPKFTNPEVQLRIQQLLILLVSRTSVRFDNLPFVHRLINMLYSLDNAHNSFIRKNSVSSLLQIVILLINEAKDTQHHEEQLVKLLKEFILLSDNVRPEWYAEWLQPDRELSTHLLAQLIQESYFRQELPRYEKLIISLVAITSKNLYSLGKGMQQQSPLLNRKDSLILLQNSLLFFLLYVRTLARASKLLLREFEFMETLLKQLTNKECFPFKVISHEAVTFLFNDYRWVKALLDSPQQELLMLLLQAELNEVRAICSDERLDLVTAVTEEPQQLRQLMTSNDVEVHFPEYNHGLELKLIIKDVEEVTFSLYSIYQQCYKVPLDRKYKEGPMPMGKVFAQCQRTIYDIVKALLPKEMPESLLQSLLKIIEKFIGISGCFGDYKVCGMWIKLICRHCLPTEFRLIDYRHVQINKMVLNTANCLGELLDVSAWIIIWKALENYESYYNKYLLSRQANQYLHERQNDVQILYQSLDSIFTESTKYSLEYLLTIVDSLVQVTYECLENNYSDEGKKIFSFERIGQVYRINLHRLCSVWPSLSSSLLCITTSKVSYFRTSALGLLNQLIPLTLSYLHNNPQSLSGKFTPDNYQRLIFEPWLNLVKCKFPELKEQIVVALNKIVIDYGHVLSHGWGCLLQIVKEIGDFKTMQVIIDTFLDQVDDYMELVVQIVQQFKASLTDPNQKYLCLTFLWTIGDHTHRRNKLPLLERIFALLLEPEYPFVFNPEARHSAFYIFTELLIHNCHNEPYEFWQRIFSSIEGYVRYVVGELKKTSDQKIVEEAGKNILLNLLKIYKKYLPLLGKHRQESQHQLGFFFEFSVDVLQLGNTDLFVLSLKQARQILTVRLQDALELDAFKKYLVALTEMYVVSTDLKLMKCLVSYMPPDIFELLQRCLTDLRSVFHETYRLMERIFLLRLEAEQKDVKLQNARIYFEEKLIVEMLRSFIKAIRNVEERVRPSESSPLKGKDLSEVVLRADSSRCQLPFLELFCSNFLMTLEKLLLYEDYHYLGRFLPFAVELIGALLEQDSIELSDKYLQFLQKLMLTKYNLALLKKQAKSKDNPIWHYATQEAIKLCSEWTRAGNLQQSLKLQRIFWEFLAHPQEPPETVVKCTSTESLGLYHENELFLTNYALEQFVLSSSFSDVKLSEVEALAALVSAHSQTQESESNVVSYARSNLELLFKLCERRSTESLTPQQLQLLMQRISRFLLFLLKRIADIFESFFATEKKYGSLPVTQKCVSEVVLILTKLDKLRLLDNILQCLSQEDCAKHGLNWQVLERSRTNKLLMGDSALLAYFHRMLTNCVRSKEQDVRDKVCTLLERLGELMLAL